MRSAYLVFGFVVLASSCGGSRGSSQESNPARDSWNVTAKIPSDTPYVFATLTALPEPVAGKLSAGIDSQFAQVTQKLEPVLAGESAPWAKAARSLINDMKAQPIAQFWQTAGFARGGRFAFYGLSVWPVLRAEVARADALSKLIRRTMTAAGMPATSTRQGDWETWQLRSGQHTVLIAVSAREAVASLLPSEFVTKALPQVLGLQRPPRSLAEDGTIPALLKQHRLLPQLVSFVDARAVQAILSGRSAGLTGELSRSMRMPSSCVADFDRIVALFPRMVFGYHSIDEKSFSGGLVIEMAPKILSALGALSTSAAGVTWPVAGKPLFAMASAIDIGAAVRLIADLGAEIEARPFACSGLAELNRSAPGWRKLPDSSLPPILTGIRGISLVVDDATISPPGGVGHVRVVSEQMETLPNWLAFVPGLGGLSLRPDGVAVALPLDQLGAGWVQSAHAALRGDSLVVAVGADSARRASTSLPSAVPQRSPLFSIAYDADRLRKLSPVLSEALLGSSVRDAAMVMDLNDQGLNFTVDGRW